MESKKQIYKAVFLEKTKKFINDLTASEQGKLASQIDMMQNGQFEIVNTKLLKKPIRELVFGKYRFIFFIEKNFIYFINSFIKKTQKTPRKYIELSEKIYKTLVKKH